MQPLVITCFAGVPDYRVISPFAAGQQQRWGQSTGPVEQRRREDVTATAYLGARCQHWSYLDCIYRRHPASGEFLYASEVALFAEVRREEYNLIDELALRLGTSLLVEGAVIYAPLAVGRHVDHQLVFRAVLKLRGRGFQVRFYEDYPYAEEAEELGLALQQWASPPLPVVQLLSEEDLRGKVAAIRLYRSQLDVLFGSELSVATRVRSYALAVGGGDGYGERYWGGGKR
jgi:LmbE family N-acetylglucosaminyl deacetylase